MGRTRRARRRRRTRRRRKDKKARAARPLHLRTRTLRSTLSLEARLRLAGRTSGLLRSLAAFLRPAGTAGTALPTAEPPTAEPPTARTATETRPTLLPLLPPPPRPPLPLRPPPQSPPLLPRPPRRKLPP